LFIGHILAQKQKKEVNPLFFVFVCNMIIIFELPNCSLQRGFSSASWLDGKTFRNRATKIERQGSKSHFKIQEII